MSCYICKNVSSLFFFAVNINEIKNVKSIYTFEQRIFVSVWEHEQPQTGKKMNHAWEIFQQRFGQEILP